MRLPMEWLREFVPFDGETTELADRLTMTGLEVEAIERPGAGIEGVVIGEVLEAGPHPNADRLSLCRVTTGAEAVSIVCGAPNVARGQRVAVAVVGARLPGGLEIAKAKIRGETSHGMICSESELGLGEDTAGIMVLDPQAPVGTSFVEWAGLDEEILSIAVGPNRPDALCIYGLARETAALFGLPLTPYEPAVDEEGPPAERAISVEIEDLAGCPRYCARLIRGVGKGPGPEWMARRLRAAGMRPISVIVDITNYVMLEIGQPLHAFDLTKVPGGRIVVRRARPGERLTTLDDVQRTLDDDMLLITGGDDPLAIAGVMGGAGSEIGEHTEDILLESAYFDPVRVAVTGGRLGLFSESRRRFERGTDPTRPPAAANRAASLMAELAGGRVAPGIVEGAAEDPVPHRTILTRKAWLDGLLGRRISVKKAVALLAGTGFEVDADSGAKGEWQVRVPDWRPDVVGPAHVAEELARLYGYNNLGSDTRISGGPPAGHTPRQRLREHVRDALAGLGFHEVVTTSLVSPQTEHPLTEGQSAVELANPFSEERSILRRDLVGPLLEVVAHNLNRQQDDVRVFEVGPVYRLQGEEVVQEEWVAAMLVGGRTPAVWSEGAGVLGWIDVSGLIEAFFEALRLDAPGARAYDGPAFAPGTAARFMGIDEEVLGWSGALSVRLIEGAGIEETVWALAFRMEGLASQPLREGRYRGLPRFPASDRDLSITLPDREPVGDLIAAVAALPGVERIRLIDEYHGEQVEEGRLGVTLSVRYRNDNKTLTDSEIEGLHGAVVEYVERSHQARLRGA